MNAAVQTKIDKNTSSFFRKIIIKDTVYINTNGNNLSIPLLSIYGAPSLSPFFSIMQLLNCTY